MDSREAERMAKYFFPQTYGTFVEGLRTHWTYKGIVTETARKFPDGKTIAELRSGGIQVIAPSLAPAKLFNNKIKKRTDNQHPIVDAPDDLIERYNKQQSNVKNNREYEALTREVELQNLDIQLANKRI